MPEYLFSQITSMLIRASFFTYTNLILYYHFSYSDCVVSIFYMCRKLTLWLLVTTGCFTLKWLICYNRGFLHCSTFENVGKILAELSTHLGRNTILKLIRCVWHSLHESNRNKHPWCKCDLQIFRCWFILSKHMVTLQINAVK